MTRNAVRSRAAALAALSLLAGTALAAPAAAADPDGRRVVVDHGLRPGPEAGLASPAFARASAVAAAKAPKAKKKLKTLVVPVYWSGAGKDSSNAKVKKRVKATMKAADTFYRTVSGGRLGHQTTVLSWQKISRPPVSCGISYQMDHIASKASARAKKAGKNPSKFDRVIFYVTQKACGENHWGAAGLGSMPGRFVWLEGTLATNVVIHELGHNLGLSHSAYAECRTKKGTRTVLAADKYCARYEYGDMSDVMGNNPDAGWFSAPKLARLGWLKGKALAKNTSTKSKTYTLRPLSSSSSKLKAVRVKGTQGRTYWVEYRTRSGLDASIARGLEGVQVRLGRPSDYSGESTVLDMLPAPDSDWYDQHTVALGAKASWTSPEGIRFTVRSTGKNAKVTVTRKAAKAKKPAAPTAKATSRDLGAKVSWGYPKDNGSPVLAYQVRVRSSDGQSTTHEVSQFLEPSRSLVLTDLDPSQSYRVSVRARNERGTSAWSKAVSVTPLDLPPSVTIQAPSEGASVRGKVRVTVTPSLAKGSGAELRWVEACIATPEWLLACSHVNAWGHTSGKKLELDVDLPEEASGPATLQVEVGDSAGRVATASRSLTIAP